MAPEQKNMEIHNDGDGSSMRQRKTNKYHKKNSQTNEESNIVSPSESENMERRSDRTVDRIPSGTLKLWIVILTVLGIGTRFYSIHYPDEVVFDEVHFGKFASFYLRGTYYFDVHPPLGKLMIAASGWVAGYNGSYTFDKIHEEYKPRNVPYIVMRSGPALFGALLVPLVFLILIESKHSLRASLLGAFMVLFENSLITQSRFILLDSFLIFFDFLALYSWIKFFRIRKNEFTPDWWKWLTFSGISLALTVGVKLVGILIIALVAFSCLRELWIMMDIQRKRTDLECVNNFLARFVTLCVLPIVIYLSFFWIHFFLLTKSGPGDSFMTPQFQATLKGNKFAEPSEAVYYGANVTIVHQTERSYLHSHFDRYPLKHEDGKISSQGQQVTGYSFEDSNNIWQFHPIDGEYFTVEQDGSKSPRLVRNQDVVRLFHVNTNKTLLTHDVASPLTTAYQEVTCVNPDERLDETSWIIEIQGKNSDNNTRINTVTTEFRIVQQKSGLALVMSKDRLPKWGFEQLEVNCMKPVDKNFVYKWLVSTNNGEHGKILNEREEQEHPWFLKKFWELQDVIFSSNSNIKGHHPYASAPSSWPFMYRGISFWVKKPDRQIYLIGNPLAWWSGTLAVFFMICCLSVHTILNRRGIDDLGTKLSHKLNTTYSFFLLGWMSHYLPFFLMGRTLFLHHYLPALIYSCKRFF
jgi:dolichyl-phosphate-mannose-protein mannosyltransferase